MDHATKFWFFYSIKKFHHFENSVNLVFVEAQDALLIEMIISKKQATTVNGPSAFIRISHVSVLPCIHFIAWSVYRVFCLSRI